jgi:L-iditol 2-dehydrogenase
MLSTDAASARSIAARRFMVRAPMEFRSDATRAVVPPDAYVVRVDACGLCRSDLSSATSWAADWDEPGHEFGGTVVEAPPDGRFQTGRRVAIRNASACGGCPPCLAGRPRECQRLVVNKQGYRDFAVCDERSLVAADGLDDELLSLVEPVNVAYDLVLSAALTPGDRVLVLGGGPLGILASRLVSIESGGAPLVVGRRALPPGFEDLPFCRESDVNRDVFRSRLGGPPTVTLVTAPPSALPAAVGWSASGGRVLTLGLDRAEQCSASISIWDLVFKRLQLAGVFAVPNLHFERAVAFLAAHGEQVRRLVTGRVSFDGLSRHFEAWHAGRVAPGKTILVNGPGRDHAAIPGRQSWN